MCGFTGYISNKGTKKDTIAQMSSMIKHRGPDDASYYVDDYLALGFRRLSIIDLDNGRQPMENETGNLVITFNGEIYNYQELAKELKKRGHIFKTGSDTEVIIHGYEEYGKDIVTKLRGMFAFVIWNKQTKELFGARDPFGIKPFYYYQDKDIFMFASEIKSFLGHEGFKKELNRKALKTYLTFQYSALDETFFKGVFRLKPGHYFMYRHNQLSISSYFEFQYEEKHEELTDGINSINNILKESVEYHKRSDVSLGAFLSGGVDSSYIVATLLPNTTYSVGFDFEKFNETNEAKDLSDLLKIENKRKLISADEFMEGVKMVQYYSDEPHANLSAVGLYYLSSLACRDVKVVLSGEGADELYGGYELYNQSKAFIKYRRLPKIIRGGIGKLASKLPDMRGKQFLIKGGKDIEDYYIGQAFIFDNDESNNILKKKYQTNIKYQDVTKPYFDKVKGKSDIVKMQYLDMHLWLPNDILLKADKMTMANSLELRVPFLDKEVFKHSITIDDQYKISDGITKYMFREASKKRLPNEWSNRKKKGFPVPFAIWLKEKKIYREVKDLFNSQHAEEFFEIDKINKLLDDHYNNKKNNGRKIYTIYCFLLWYKIYFIDM